MIVSIEWANQCTCVGCYYFRTYGFYAPCHVEKTVNKGKR